ncbi:MAG TPA: carbon monoxide dehydrogenase, partial [Ktedonobacter sp.]|nr:carbon monoxide dehydrogenase [Ktedonobacter sp.]
MATEVFKHGLGEPYKRKEDARFIRGEGKYVDDVQLKGMLYGDIVRSPYAHALIKSIDISEAMKVPGVVAVITGKDLDAAGLAWMPTLSGDTEAVLALDRVHFQMQEVAFVVATSRYAAADGAAAVEVEYEPLQVIVDPKKALDPDAPLLRPDKKDKQPTNQIYHWETGDRTGTDEAFTDAEANGIVVKQDMFIPRIHPAPIETCGCVADYNKTTAKLTVWLTSQAPHVHRTLFAIVAGLPEHRIRIISPDVGGGFGNKVPIYPGYVCAVVASLTTGKPVKWIEDRSENIAST